MTETVTHTGFNKGDVVIEARSVYPKGALEVAGRDEQGKLLAHPLGGGPQFIISLKGESELRIVPIQEQQPLWKRAKFSLDGLDGIFEGWSSGELWNGWDMPAFEIHEARRLISKLPEAKPRFDGAKDSFITESDGEEEVWAAENLTLFGNQQAKAYGIGAGSWCWEVAS